MKIRLNHIFSEISSIENLLEAWTEFIKGKRHKNDVREFQINLMDNIFMLHNDLINYTYRHGGYQAFKIKDPKPRDIHKASVRDRLLHHAIKKLRCYFWKASQNNNQTCYYLKMDIRKFFANIDHEILLNILRRDINDDSVQWLLENIIDSFETKQNIGLPLGNLTSQLFVNIYMNKFDQFVKHHLKEKYYIRYADDFIILSPSYSHLVNLVSKIMNFLESNLHLQAHPDKIFIKTFASGLDFLGYVNFTDHIILRPKTERRMIKRININNKSSYLGLLKHCNSFKLRQRLKLN